ncbi:hypothetical protein F503_05913 [Ophiostoma piceae UAMH 11346]|uniref:Uncharacterized protein n=1 Tax=Ophiostoma piceae (strain UAMH 11346) TaxID=1262450 RepID=S3CVU1_OPHP1|nr:hypothetical protein F503_05913 [Ophiostoma piceae UAMH 11346]
MIYNGMHNQATNGLNFDQDGNLGLGLDLGVTTPYGVRPGSSMSSQGGYDGHESDQMGRLGPAYDGSQMIGMGSFAFNQYPYQTNNMAALSGLSSSQSPSPLAQQTGFQQQQQQQQQRRLPQMPMTPEQSHQARYMFGWLPQQPARPQLTLVPPQQPLTNWNADQTGSLGTPSPQGYLSGGAGTPGSSAMPTLAFFPSGRRQPSQTPDTPGLSQASYMAAFSKMENNLMNVGGAINSPQIPSPGSLTTISTPQLVLDPEVQMPSPSFSQSALNNVLDRDTNSQKSALLLMPASDNMLPPPSNTHRVRHRLSSSTLTSDNSYANVTMSANNSQNFFYSALPSPSVAGATMGDDPTTPSFFSSPTRPAVKGVPNNHLNNFRAVPGTKRRESDSQLGPPNRRPKRETTKRACIQCYLSRKKCFNSRFDDQNIFVQCLPEELAQLVATITTKKNWMAERADIVLSRQVGKVDLKPALEIVSLQKLGHKDGYELSVQRTPNLQHDFVFGPLYHSCLLLQSRAVLERHTGSAFRYTKEFENYLLMLRAISSIRVFRVIEHRMEKNKILKSVPQGSRRACILTTIIGMLLDQTLGFEASLPKTETLDNELLENARHLAYHLAHRLLFMAKRALRDANPSVEKYVHIGETIKHIEIDDKLWTELREAHEAYTLSPGMGPNTANSNTPYSSAATPGPGADTGASSEQPGTGGPGPSDSSRGLMNTGLAPDSPKFMLRSTTGEGSSLQRIDVPTVESETPPRRGRKGGNDLADFDDPRDEEDTYWMTKMITSRVDISTLTEKISYLAVANETGDESGNNREGDGDGSAATATDIASTFMTSHFNADTYAGHSAIGPPPPEDIEDNNNIMTMHSGDFVYYPSDAGFDELVRSERACSPSDVLAGNYDQEEFFMSTADQTWANARNNPQYQGHYDDMEFTDAVSGGTTSFVLDNSASQSNDCIQPSPASNMLPRAGSLLRHLSNGKRKGKEILSGFMARSNSPID